MRCSLVRWPIKTVLTAGSTRKSPVKPAEILALVREIRSSARRDEPLAVAGARGPAASLREELVRGGVAAAVREQGPVRGAAAFVYVLAGKVRREDERAFAEASRARVPIIAVLVGGARDLPPPPHVLARDVIRVGGEGRFPVDEIAMCLARRLGERATPLAARLPFLRHAVCAELIRRCSRRNGVVGVAVFVPGADLPVLTMNELRLVLRIADAHGFEIDHRRLPEVLGVISSGLGFRAAARQALGVVPVAGWALKGAIAYTGTKTLGEAAVRYFERRAAVTRIPGARALFPRS